MLQLIWSDLKSHTLSEAYQGVDQTLGVVISYMSLPQVHVPKLSPVLPSQ